MDQHRAFIEALKTLLECEFDAFDLFRFWCERDIKKIVAGLEDAAMLTDFQLAVIESKGVDVSYVRKLRNT